MGNRSRYLVAGAAAGATVLAARRRARLRRALEAAGESVSASAHPSSVADLRFEPDPGEAPGHRHRRGADEGAAPSRRLARSPWNLHGFRTRLPYAAD